MATTLTEAPLAGVVRRGGRRRVVLVGVVEPEAAGGADHKAAEVHGSCGGCGNCTDKADKKEDQAAAASSIAVDESRFIDDDKDVAPAHYAAELQAKRLYVALGRTTDNERDAYRRNKTEQTRLEMALEHIGVQRNIANKNLQGDLRVMKVRSSRIGERARLTREGASLRTVNSSYPRYPYGGNTDNPDVLPTIGATSGGRHAAMMTAPGGGGRRSGARSITFVSEVHPGPATDRPEDPATSGPTRSTLGPTTTNRGIRSNATRYFDTSSAHGTRSQETAVGSNGQVWSTTRARVGQPLAEKLHQRTQEAYQPADTGRARTSIVQLHQQQKLAAAKSGIKQRPLVAIVSSSLIAASRLSNAKKREAATRSLDADIDAVLNARLDGGGGEGKPASSFAPRTPGFQGVGLRQPANFSSNYRPSVGLDEQFDDDGELLGVTEEDLEEETFMDEGERGVEALRSLTSFSQRLPIDRVATPSSNAFRGEGGRRGQGAAFSAKSAPQASVLLQNELLASRGRREAHRDGTFRPFRLEQALKREVTQMRGVEDRLALFYEKLKGPDTAAGKRGGSKPNHWDLRGLDEKLMLY